MVITFTTSQSWLRVAIPAFDTIKRDEKILRQAIKEVAILALRASTDVSYTAEDDEAERQRVHISFPEPEASLLRAASAQLSLTPGQYTKQLFGALALNPLPIAEVGSDNSTLSKLIRSLADVYPGVKPRPEQLRMYSNVRDAMSQSKIGIIEGSTGVGKTRSMLCAAADWVEENHTNIVISAPTIALLRQFASEWALQNSVRAMPALRLILGKREFVSLLDLQEFLASPTGKRWDTPEIRNWIVNKGVSSTIDQGVNTRWLCHTLNQIAPGFPVDEVRLNELTSPKDQGIHAYRMQFVTKTDDGEIILCSHAMLAQHMRFRMIDAGRDEDFQTISREISSVFDSIKKEKHSGIKSSTDLRDILKSLYLEQGEVFTEMDGGLLPSFKALLVDEAHVLEEQFSTSLTEYLSLQSIGRWIDSYRNTGGDVSASIVAGIRDSIRKISAIGTSINLDILHLSSSNSRLQEISVELTEIIANIERIKFPKKPKSVEKKVAILRLRRALSQLRIATGYGISRSYLRYSPVRAFPQLYIGKTNVSNVLSLLWASVCSGAAISATLYLTNSHGETSAWYHRILLATPDSRTIEYPPTEASWLQDPVNTLWIPDEVAGKYLRPPTRSDRLKPEEHIAAEKIWISNLVEVVYGIHKKSVGGSLVLMTAYSHIEQLRENILNICPDLTLVIASSDVNLSQQKEEFLRLRHSGLKPLWIAVGAAWTGLDVGGHDPWSAQFGSNLPAENDNVLTTLIIPKLPFGTNNTITHLWRTNQSNDIKWELFETLFRLKQGLGRLIRRSGLPNNREIYVLDGRLTDSRFPNFSLFKKVMGRYPVSRLDINNFKLLAS